MFGMVCCAGWAGLHMCCWRFPGAAVVATLRCLPNIAAHIMCASLLCKTPKQLNQDLTILRVHHTPLHQALQRTALRSACSAFQLCVLLMTASLLQEAGYGEAAQQLIENVMMSRNLPDPRDVRKYDLIGALGMVDFKTLQVCVACCCWLACTGRHTALCAARCAGGGLQLLTS